MTPQSCVGLCGEGNNSWHPCAHLNDEREWAQHRECQQCMHARACCTHFHLARRAPRSCCACVTPHGSGVDLCTHAAVRCDTQGRLTQGSTVVHACKHRHLAECARHTWQSVTGTRTRLSECARHTHRHLAEWQSVPGTRTWQLTWQSVRHTHRHLAECDRHTHRHLAECDRHLRSQDFVSSSLPRSTQIAFRGRACVNTDSAW